MELDSAPVDLSRDSLVEGLVVNDCVLAADLNIFCDEYVLTDNTVNRGPSLNVSEDTLGDAIRIVFLG